MFPLTGCLVDAQVFHDRSQRFGVSCKSDTVYEVSRLHGDNATRVGSSAQTLTDSTLKALYETERGWETTGAWQNLSLSHHDPVQFACTSAILDRVWRARPLSLLSLPKGDTQRTGLCWGLSCSPTRNSLCCRLIAPARCHLFPFFSGLPRRIKSAQMLSHMACERV